MLDARSPQDRHDSTARRFFAGLTEYAFQSRLGVADPPLVDYVSELLERFVSTTSLYGVRSVRGEQLTQVADMLAEAEARIGPARRRVHRHIGDFTLFWTGVYPEMADRIKRAGLKDSLLDYRDQGRRAYFLASRIPTDNDKAPGELLERMADQFELIEYGLAEVRRLWDEGEHENEPLGIIV
ncbi:hypothetical protein Pla123a_04080 [Posidoniimonas polymericola]|uniref:Uncharacterized protein n=1 Tax=Posidoniimonas polymericola TaxID=2528002 RepID=A0A5C5ZFH9_9BACT|nr:hypothetical protein [Posidoniimonas polymericola]TWT85601.1 hypothetical protein Pla123a_04080 [Posidoniimonas polymericola]